MTRRLVWMRCWLLGCALCIACSSGSVPSRANGGSTSSGATAGNPAASSGQAGGGVSASGGANGANAGRNGSSGNANAGSAGATNACGYHGSGTVRDIGADIHVCLPPVVCNPETCPPEVGACTDGRCVFKAGYQGLATLPEAWVTQYCSLAGAGCHGVSQLEYPEVTAARVGTALGAPLCERATAGTARCVGIAASSPMVVGNSEMATDPTTGSLVSLWGLGLTEASGLCYELRGPAGTAVVALTDRCAGYCQCAGSGFQECGACVNATDLHPNCPCVGSVPGVYSECCGRLCTSTQAACDWCASNNHAHFDLDGATFDWLCGTQASNGSCKLASARFIPCLTPDPAWPPGGGAASCKSGSFACGGTASAHQNLVGGACCCNWNLCPQNDGTCTAPGGACKAGSCACGSGMPDSNHPRVTSTGCCCVYGLTPQSDGTCQ